MQIYSSYGSKEKEPWGGRERGSDEESKNEKRKQGAKRKVENNNNKTEGQSERESGAVVQDRRSCLCT